MKYLVRLKELWSGEGDWTFVKQFMGWKINTDAGTVALTEQKLQELTQLLAMSAVERRIG